MVSRDRSATGVALQAIIAVLLALQLVVLFPPTPLPGLPGGLRVGVDAARVAADGLTALVFALVVVVGALTGADRRVGAIAALIASASLARLVLELLSAEFEGRVMDVVVMPGVVALAALLAVDRLVRRFALARRGVAAGVGVVIALVATGAATYAGFYDQGCGIPACASRDALIDLAVAQRSVAGSVVRALMAFAGVVTLAAVVGTARRGPWSVRRIALVVGAVTLGLALLARASGVVAGPDDDPGLFVVGAISLGLAILLEAFELARARARVAAIADEIEAAPAPGTLATALAGALGDPSVMVGYWVEGESRYVDPWARPIDLAVGDPDRVVTTIERGGQRIAAIRHRRDVDLTWLDREVGTAMVLALDTERAQAASLAHLEELRAARRRIVEVADLTRRQIERDLHDGAQQRLLGVVFALRAAASASRRDGDGRRANRLLALEAAASSTLQDLRTLARGVHPAILTQAGLVPALASLADEAPIALDYRLALDGDLPDDVEDVAYRVVRESLHEAAGRGATYLEVSIGRDAALVRLTTEDDGRPMREVPIRILDRVGAAGGTIALQAAPDGAHTTRAIELPCA